MTIISGLSVLSYIFLVISGCRSASLKSKNDMSLHQYTDSGEVAQVYYASKAIQKSSTGLLGYCDSDFSAVFAISRKLSTLQVAREKPTVKKYGKSLGVAIIGHPADCVYACGKCNLVIQSHILRFGETPLMDNVAKAMSKWVTRGMYTGDEDAVLRPVATSVILFGRDLSGTSNRLVLLENSGSIKECDFVSIGYLPGGSTTLKKIEATVQASRSEASGTVLSDSRERQQRLIVEIAAALLEATEDFYCESSESATQPSSDSGTSENDGRKSDINIECTVSNSSVMSDTVTFSSVEKLKGLIRDGWYRENDWFND
jgi:20S proteasome alpha/beta subunit